MCLCSWVATRAAPSQIARRAPWPFAQSLNKKKRINGRCSRLSQYMDPLPHSRCKLSLNVLLFRCTAWQNTVIVAPPLSLVIHGSVRNPLDVSIRSRLGVRLVCAFGQSCRRSEALWNVIPQRSDLTWAAAKWPPAYDPPRPTSYSLFLPPTAPSGLLWVRERRPGTRTEAQRKCGFTFKAVALFNLFLSGFVTGRVVIRPFDNYHIDLSFRN